MNTEWKPIPASLYDLICTGDLEALLWRLNGVRAAEEVRMALYNARKAILDAEEHSDCTPAPTSHPIPTGATGEDWRLKFEAWSKRANQGYDLARNVSGKMATYESDLTEHAYRGFFHGASMNAPAAGDALAVEDQQYLHWMIAEECRIETLTLGNGTRYRVHWPDVDEYQAEWFFSPGGAIRAAIAQQKGEA